MKTYGRKNGRQNLKDIIADIRILQKTINRLRNYDLVPKGVYQFKTFEEADSWMMNQIVKNHVPHNLKT